LVEDLTGGPVGWWLAALFALFLAYQLSAIFRLKRELRRLQGLRVEYEEELRLDALGGEGLTH
jgi:HAMP domain-containing protein